MFADGETVGRMLLAVAVAVAVGLAGCGDDVPGNAIATVDGEPIEQESFDHWLAVAARSGGGPDATVPEPPDYANCDKPKRECQAEYEALRDQVLQMLVSVRWVEGEASDRGLSVEQSEVEKAFEEQKQHGFAKGTDFERFLKTSGQTEHDILMRVRLDLLWTKIRDQATKGEDAATDEQVRRYYEENRERFTQPERRDLKLVLTRSRARAGAAMAALAAGRPWGAVASEHSIDEATKGTGGTLADVVRGQREKTFDTAIFRAPVEAVRGPVKTRFGYYVFEVTNVEEASKQTLEQATPTIMQLLAAETQQDTLQGFVERFREKWRERTECRDGFVTADCNNGPSG